MENISTPMIRLKPAAVTKFRSRSSSRLMKGCFAVAVCTTHSQAAMAAMKASIQISGALNQSWPSPRSNINWPTPTASARNMNPIRSKRRDWAGRPPGTKVQMPRKDAMPKGTLM